IARDYLIPKLLKELGLEGEHIVFKDDALYEIIRHYTKESGVRELERQISSMLRKTAVQLVEGKKLRRLTFTKAKVHKLLGAQKFVGTNIKPHPTVGYAVGLAWTELGELLLTPGVRKLPLALPALPACMKKAMKNYRKVPWAVLSMISRLNIRMKPANGF
ncbi:unnamed protein product, partial [marine sediment metagenome]